MNDYNNLVIDLETMIFNHGLFDHECFSEIKQYKYMTPELKCLMPILEDTYRNNQKPIPREFWDLCPLFYEKFFPKAHGSIQKVFKAAKNAKARVYTYNKLSEHIGWVSNDKKPLILIIDEIIADMKVVRVALDE